VIGIAWTIAGLVILPENTIAAIADILGFLFSSSAPSG
jgi:hypothetical protein